MQNREDLIELKWQPETYNKLSFAQNNAVLNILKTLKVKENAKILDLGCGDGKISAKLSKIADKGSVLGVDKSSEMIDFATSNYESAIYPNLRFLMQDAQRINFSEEFDLVFSSFALQWIENKVLFFTKAYDSLKKGGEICVIVPLGVSNELELATKAVTESRRWRRFYKNFRPNWHFASGVSLMHLMQESFFSLTHSSLYTEEVIFPCLEDFKQYILLWFPYLSPLDEVFKPVFFSQVIDKYLEILPPKENEMIVMKIPVISVIGSKINL